MWLHIRILEYRSIPKDIRIFEFYSYSLGALGIRNKQISKDVKIAIFHNGILLGIKDCNIITRKKLHLYSTEHLIFTKFGLGHSKSGLGCSKSG